MKIARENLFFQFFHSQYKKLHETRGKSFFVYRTKKSNWLNLRDKLHISADKWIDMCCVNCSEVIKIKQNCCWWLLIKSFKLNWIRGNQSGKMNGFDWIFFWIGNNLITICRQKCQNHARHAVLVTFLTKMVHGTRFW